MRLPGWISVFFLVLLGYIAVVPNGYAQDSVECGPETFSPTDCPLSSLEEETNVDVGGQLGNIEEQIPSVIPFP
jgi:hypothetical protein